MEFTEHKPIYLQISDKVCDRIVNKEWNADERIPSVRELGAELGVNPNTIMRTYEHLQNKEIIQNKRGVGYFVSTDAKDKIIAIQREQFMNEDLPDLRKKMFQLGIDPCELFNCK